MADVTLATMRTQALREADAEGHLDMSVTADKDRVTDYVNAGCARLHGILTETFEDYDVQLSSAVTISSGDSASLASAIGGVGILKVRFVEYSPSANFGVGASDLIDVDPIAMAERNRYSGPRGYFIAGRSSSAAVLYIRPTAEALGSYRLWYTPSFTDLAADGDVFRSVNDWHRWAVLDAAIKLKGDMDRSAAVLLQRQTDLEKHIRSIAARRISGRPSKVRKVRKTLLERVRDYEDPSRWTP
jgi:hypothetical protein